MRTAAPWLVLALAACTGAPPKPTPAGPTSPPLARRVPHPTTVHGVTLQDDWAWLRNKDSPEVLDYLKAENAWTAATTRELQPLREELYAQLVGRLQEDDESPPEKEGQWWWVRRSLKGKQYQQILRRRGGPTAPDELVLDANALAAGKKFFGLGLVKASDDGLKLAWSVDETGFRQYELRTKDLATGAEGSERIPRVTSFAWAADNRTLLYVEEDPVTKRPFKVWRHELGAAKDALVYEEKDERFSVRVGRSRDKELLFVTSHSHTQTEQRWLPARAPLVPPKLIQERAPELEYDCDHREGWFWCLSNDAGKNFRLVKAPVGTPDLPRWLEVVPHRPEVMLEDLTLLRDHAVLTEREAGVPEVRVLFLRQRSPFAASHRVALPEPVRSVRAGANADFDTRTLRLSYTSPITPQSWFDYDLAERKLALVKETLVPNYDRTRYQVERLAAAAADGTAIPVTLISRKGAPRDGSGALHLTGYGAYGFPSDARFSPVYVTEVDRGLSVAIAHVRGGGDLGKRWHDEGRMLKKMNTFTDFIAVADFLVAQKVAPRERLAISGGSAGGLLVGAVINLRPDLCRAAYLAVPFVDVMNTMLDSTLPLTVGEFEEWGNPRASKEQFDAMLAYSPYDNLKDVRYPSVLVRTSYNDSQVMYWEPAKYVARMRATRKDAGPVLLDVNLEPAGHGGASGRYDRLRERAWELSWMLREVGLAK